jgi:hypothetical protein
MSAYVFGRRIPNSAAVSSALPSHGPCVMEVKQSR